MKLRTAFRQFGIWILVVWALVGCGNASSQTVQPTTPISDETALASYATALTPEVAVIGTPLAGYEFPGSIDPQKQYMFYLHGKIIEDQGLPAVSRDYGEYEYAAILEKLEGKGFVVISERRPRDTAGTKYAHRVVEQITVLLNAGVPPEQVTVIGASQGAGIAATVSHLLKNKEANYVLLGFCSPDEVRELKQNQISLYGNVLAMYDSVDALAGPCEELFAFSEGKGIGRHGEIVLHIGTGHGILYKPLDEWILPAVDWAKREAGETLTAEQAATLNSLQQLDDYPLYRMTYFGSYALEVRSYATVDVPAPVVPPSGESCSAAWGCSLFAALGDEEDRLYGRNFDWQFSPALLLFTDPPDGYASVSMVDIDYLGFPGDGSRDVTALPLKERKALLEAPSLPFDGMNEEGLAVGMAAVPPGEMPIDSQKKTLDELQVIREILDHAATVDEAIDILGMYNIDMGSVPIHYLIASASGNSALVEFYQGEMKVFRNEFPWQAATNFLLASTHGRPGGQCWRYDLINQRLEEAAGRLSPQNAARLLADVSQDNTQWSILYHMTSGDVQIVMGRDYSGITHTLHLDRKAQ